MCYFSSGCPEMVKSSDILGSVPQNEEWSTGPHWGEGDGDPRTEERSGGKCYEKSKVKDGRP